MTGRSDIDYLTDPNWGGHHRRQLGVTGGPEDAQKVAHDPVTVTGFGRFCIVCGLGVTASVHREGN